MFVRWWVVHLLLSGDWQWLIPSIHSDRHPWGFQEALSVEGVSNGAFLRTTLASRPSGVARPGEVSVSVRGYIHKL